MDGSIPSFFASYVGFHCPFLFSRFLGTEITNTGSLCVINEDLVAPSKYGQHRDPSMWRSSTHFCGNRYLSLKKYFFANPVSCCQCSTRCEGKVKDRSTLLGQNKSLNRPLTSKKGYIHVVQTNGIMRDKQREVTSKLPLKTERGADFR